MRTVSKIHSMKLQEPHFSNLKNGSKIYEICINDPRKQKMNIGDIIKIIANNDEKNNYQVVIVGKDIFTNFKNAIQDSGVKKIAPNLNSINSCVKMYETHKGYSEGVDKHGVVRFMLVVNNNRKIHNLTIQNPKECPAFDLIASKQKTIEGRKNSPTYQAYKAGDYLNLINSDGRTLMTLITHINKYSDVEEYLKTETLKKALPCVKTIHDGVNMYNKWTTPAEREMLRKKYGYGFLAIHIVF